MTQQTTIHTVHIHNVSNSSSLLYGDICLVHAASRNIAVERSLPIFRQQEGNYADFMVFAKPLAPAIEPDYVTLSVHNESSNRKINLLNINEVVASSLVQIGNTDHTQLISRMKYLRQEAEVNPDSPVSKSLKVY